MKRIKFQDCKHEAARSHGFVPGAQVCPDCGAVKVPTGDWQMPRTAANAEWEAKSTPNDGLSLWDRIKRRI